MADAKPHKTTDSQRDQVEASASREDDASSGGQDDERSKEVRALTRALQKVLEKNPGEDSASGVSGNALRDPQRVLSSLAKQAVTRFHQGPLPPPDVLAGYENAIPGSAERILQMAEAEALHRRQCENKELAIYEEDLHAERRQFRIGQIFGLMISSMALGVACLVALFQPGWAGSVFGTVLGTGTLASLVAVFITGKRAESKSAGSSATLPPGQEDE